MSADLAPQALSTRWMGRALETHDRLDSTSRRLWALAAEDAPHGTLVVAAAQTEGRGRQGRSWTSVPGNLFASFLLRFDDPPPDVSALSLVVGLEITLSLREDFGLTTACVKWPNDVWIDDRKAAGVLLEARHDTALQVVVGLGLNLRAPADGWGALANHAVALEEHEVSTTPAAVLEVLLPRIERGVEDFLARGFAPRAAQWSACDALDGRRVDYEHDGQVRRGRVDGVGPDGSLRVTHADGSTARLFGAEVHLVEVGV